MRDSQFAIPVVRMALRFWVNPLIVPVGSGGASWAIINALDTKQKTIGTGEDNISPTVARDALLSLFRAGMHVTTIAGVSTRLAAWGLAHATPEELDRSAKPGRDGGGKRVEISYLNIISEHPTHCDAEISYSYSDVQLLPGC